MACNASKAPLLRALAKRGYAAQACASAGAQSDVKTSTLPNKMVVASVPSIVPATRVSIIFRAGSRYEDYDTLGAAHYLRAAVGLSTQNASSFAIMRNIQQVGGNLSATGDRETLTVTVEGTADKMECILNFLNAAVTCPAFKPWELRDLEPRLRELKKHGSPTLRAINLVHRAAYRDTLGNSIYCPKHQIGKISTETLLHYYAKTCTPSRTAVVASGIDHNILEGFAQNLELENGEATDKPACYRGGDARKDKHGNLTHIAVVGEGGSLASHKEALAFEIMQLALGSASAKRGNVNGGLGKAIGSALGGSRATYSAYNVSYSDSGLFGAVMSVEAKDAGKAVDAAVKALKCASVNDCDFQRGKALLKAKLLSASDSSNVLSDLGRQAAITGQVVTPQNAFKLIDLITKADVDTAAQKVGRSKLSIAAVGNLGCVPYSDDLA